MRKLIFSSLAAVLAATAMPAMADDTTTTAARGEQTTQAPRARTPQADSERRICVREASSESRIRRRICRTAQEWRDLHGAEINDPR